jgi:hypothetical protein
MTAPVTTFDTEYSDPAAQKFANLRANPHVVLTTGCNWWDQGLDVVLEVDPVRVTDDAVLSRIAGAFAATKHSFRRDGQHR